MLSVVMALFFMKIHHFKRYAFQFLNFNMLFEILMGSLEKLLGIRILNCTLELEQNDFNFLLMGGGGGGLPKKHNPL